MDPLYKGALKSAVSTACAAIVALPVIDPKTFSPATLHGALNTALVILWLVIVSEARYFGKWADEITGNGTPK